jgi:hypothetical protein
MDVLYAYDRLTPQYALSDYVGTAKEKGYSSLNELAASGSAFTKDGALVVGQGRDILEFFGVIMVGGHRSIQRELLDAGNTPLIQANTHWIMAYWGEEKRTSLFGRNKTWLILTGVGFFGMGYPHVEKICDYNLACLDSVTPRALAEVLTKIWSKYFK